MGMTPVVVKPPMYRFPYSENEQIKNWGWYLASDLLFSIQNLFHIYRRISVTSKDVSRYCFIKAHNKFLGQLQGLLIVKRDGTHSELLGYEEDGWFHSAVLVDCYVPAGLGLKLIEATEKDTLHLVEVPSYTSERKIKR